MFRRRVAPCGELLVVVGRKLEQGGALVFRTYFGSRTREHPGVLASVMLEPDTRRVRLTWQTSLPVTATQIDHLDQTIIEEAKD